MMYHDELLRNLKICRMSDMWIVKNSKRQDIIDEAKVDIERMNIVISEIEKNDTHRILFDSRQATVFEKMESPIPETHQSKLNMPFSSFFLEFTEPVVLGNPEPGYDREFARAVLVMKDNVTDFILLTFFLENPKWFESESLSIYEGKYAEFPHIASAAPVTWRSFRYSLETGLAYSTIESLQSGTEPSVFPEEMIEKIREGWFFKFLNDGYPDDNFTMVPCGILPEEEGRHVGWFEREAIGHAGFLGYCLSYMMSKSVSIDEIPISRQQKRYNDRKGITVKPWHQVNLDPRFYRTVEEPDGSRINSHNVRYDVIGHLRFGNHKLKNGEYRETIEWVNPHQRGLKNDIYVPKVHRIKGNRQIDTDRMDEYFES
jgi:hypothetical protein